jgi:hypothetical protein
MIAKFETKWARFEGGCFATALLDQKLDQEVALTWGIGLG